MQNNENLLKIMVKIARALQVKPYKRLKIDKIQIKQQNFI